MILADSVKYTNFGYSGHFHKIFEMFFTTLLHENFAAWKFRGHFNFAVFLDKIAFRCILISRFRQNYEFRDILISRFEQKDEIQCSVFDKNTRILVHFNKNFAIFSKNCILLHFNCAVELKMHLSRHFNFAVFEARPRNREIFMPRNFHAIK